MLRFHPLGHRATCLASKTPRVLSVICFVVAGADSASFASVAFLTLTWDIQHRTENSRRRLSIPDTLSPSSALPVTGAAAAPFAAHDASRLDAVYTAALLTPTQQGRDYPFPSPDVDTEARNLRARRQRGRSLGSSFHASFCPGPRAPCAQPGVQPSGCPARASPAESRAHRSGRHFCERCKCSQGNGGFFYVERDRESF